MWRIERQPSGLEMLVGNASVIRTSLQYVGTSGSSLAYSRGRYSIPFGFNRERDAWRQSHRSGKFYCNHLSDIFEAGGVRCTYVMFVSMAVSQLSVTLLIIIIYVLHQALVWDVKYLAGDREKWDSNMIFYRWLLLQDFELFFAVQRETRGWMPWRLQFLVCSLEDHLRENHFPFSFLYLVLIPPFFFSRS